MSVKEPHDSGWKEKVLTRIRRSDGVIVLVSENSLTSDGQAWEIQCAQEEGKDIQGIWAYRDDRTTLAGVNTVEWSDNNIASFIDSL
nr:TIR domain-containing protein [Rhodococcus sp. 15-1154-1]